ncbi:MAG: hypothetical protein RR234_03985 [Christensenella sp.]
MNKVICVYDNHTTPNVFIKSVIGDKTFGDIILKRRSIRDKFQDVIKGTNYISEIIEINHDWEITPVLQKLRALPNDVNIVHVFSQFVAKDNAQAALLLEKSQFVQDPLIVMQEHLPVMFMMRDMLAYTRFLEKNLERINTPELYEGFNVCETANYYNISIHANFLQYISGGFDARFFNSVQGDEFTVTKSSPDKAKMRAEYSFYHLLPDNMKMWFVMPYDFQEHDDYSSYTMERYHMTDLAIRWVHGAIDKQECAQLLHKTFHFINCRAQKSIDVLSAHNIADALYLNKIDARIEMLKKHDLYPKLAGFITSGTKYKTIDDIVQRYKDLYAKLSPQRNDTVAVIGHGDLCFSNMLFNKETDLLKLIDPKGAVTEDGLWTDRYYDVAKLSHSICGKYDFFNNSLHNIVLNPNLEFDVEINFDNSEYIELFKSFCEQYGFDYTLVRLYEASLFISMLPLHMDNPQKVFGFILNSIRVLDEVEKCLKK